MNLRKLWARWQPYQQHPDPHLQKLWDWFQLAFLVLPAFSLLGSVGIVLVYLGIWSQKATQIVRRPLNQGFALLGILILISALLAHKPGEALLGLFNFLPYFWGLAALTELIHTVGQLRRLAWIAVIGSVPIILIGMAQQLLGWGGKIHWGVVSWTILPGGNPPGRMASVFVYATALGSYLIVTVILSLGLWIEAFSKAQKTLQKAPLPTPYSLPQHIFLSLALLGNTIALVLTNSRNAWAIALLAFAAFALYLGWRWLLAGAAAISGTVLGAAFAPAPLREWLRTIVPMFFWARLTDELYPNRPVGDLRTTQWQFAWSMAQQRPFLGWGLRNFSPLYQEQVHFLIGHPHNLLLMLACETGFPATLLFFGLVGWVVFRGALLLQQERGSGGVKSEAVGSEEVDGFLLNSSQKSPRDRLILFTYLTAFMGCTLFSMLDVTLFDIRINLLGWILLGGIGGLVYRDRQF